MPRLFIAIDPPDNVRDALAKIMHGVAGARWTPVDQLHLTLRFLGEVDGALFNDIADQLSAVESDAFSLQLCGIGFFQMHGRPQTLWAKVAPSDALNALHQKIDAQLHSLKILKQGKQFVPHVTLARLHNPDEKQVASFLETHDRLQLPPWPAEEFHLYSSQLTPKRALHTIEYSYPIVEKSKLSFREKWQRGLVE